MLRESVKQLDGRFDLHAVTAGAEAGDTGVPSGDALIEFAEKHQIPIPTDKRGEAPFSVDANLLHISYEGDNLEDPWVEPDPEMWRWTVAPEDAPDQAVEVELEFAAGDPIGIDGELGTIIKTINSRYSPLTEKFMFNLVSNGKYSQFVYASTFDNSGADIGSIILPSSSNSMLL